MHTEPLLVGGSGPAPLPGIQVRGCFTGDPQPPPDGGWVGTPVLGPLPAQQPGRVQGSL